jgi:hypothetical protein
MIADPSIVVDWLNCNEILEFEKDVSLALERTDFLGDTFSFGKSIGEDNFEESWSS